MDNTEPKTKVNEAMEKSISSFAFGKGMSLNEAAIGIGGFQEALAKTGDEQFAREAALMLWNEVLKGTFG